MLPSPVRLTMPSAAETIREAAVREDLFRVLDLAAMLKSTPAGYFDLFARGHAEFLQRMNSVAGHHQIT